MEGVRRLKIAHVYNELDPKNGGPPHVIVGLAAGQMRLGHEVIFLSEDAPVQPDVDRFLSTHLGQAPHRISIQPSVFRPGRSLPALNAALQDVDIVHCHGIWPVAPMVASRVARARSIPYIVAPHGSLHAGALDEKKLKKLIGMWTLGYRDYIRHAAALHALNTHEALGARLPFYRGVQLPDTVSTIPNGIFEDMLEADTRREIVDRLIPGLNGAPYILYLARLHPGKGCELLGAAFADIAQRDSQVHLVMVGQDQGGRSMAEAPLKTAGCLDRVHFTGPIFDDRKHALYKNAAVYCLPSRHEGFSMAITEALAWSTPVVATNTCFFPEITAFECGIEVPYDQAALSQALMDILRNPDESLNMGRRGRELVTSTYTWSRIAEQTIALYRKCGVNG